MNTAGNELDAPPAARLVRRGAVAVAGLLVALMLPASGTNRPPGRSVGVSYQHDEVKEVPWSIHVVKIDRGRRDLLLTTTLGRGSMIGMSLVSDQLRAVPALLGRPLAGINGDFYHNTSRYPGDPEGLQIVRGELISAPVPTRSCFWIDAAGAPHLTNMQSRFTVTWPDGSSTPFGLNEDRDSGAAVLFTGAIGATTRTSGGLELVVAPDGTNASQLPLQLGHDYAARVRLVSEAGNSPLTPGTAVLSLGGWLARRVPRPAVGQVLKLSTATLPNSPGARTAVGGGPALVRDGKALPFTGFQRRHPRSAVGWNGTSYFFIEVDGRQTVSVGMSFPELADYMVKLGCTDGLNLDGGGSATLWAYGAVVNSPSEGQERPAANALVVVQEAPPQ